MINKLWNILLQYLSPITESNKHEDERQHFVLISLNLTTITALLYLNTLL